MKLRISKYYQSWKDITNNKVTIVPKNIKNDIPTNITNYTPWNEECAIKKYKFNQKHFFLYSFFIIYNNQNPPASKSILLSKSTSRVSINS